MPVRTSSALALLVAAAACTLTLRAERSDGVLVTSLTADTSRQTVIAEGTSSTSHQHPTVVRTSEGLLAVWTSSHAGPCGPAALSTDDGVTWTRVDGRFPAGYANNVNCPSVYRLADASGTERLWIWSQCKMAADADKTLSNYNGRYGDLTQFMPSVMSEDEGLTWSEQTPLGEKFVCVMAFSSIVPLAQRGSYLGFFHRGPEGRDTSPLTVWQSKTTDGGFTWSDPVEIAAVSGLDLCEPCAFLSPAGHEICCIMRENKGWIPSYMMFSSDEGATWSTPVAAPNAAAGHRHQAVRLDDGRYLIAFRGGDWGSSKAAADYRAWVGTYAQLKGTAGIAGSGLVELLPNYNGTNCGYSGLTMLADGTVVGVAYTGYHSDTSAHGPSVVAVRLDSTTLATLGTVPTAAEKAAEEEAEEEAWTAAEEVRARAAAAGVSVSGDASFQTIETDDGTAMVFTNASNAITLTMLETRQVVRLLLVGGGGGGGGARGGGGGAGGYLEYSTAVQIPEGGVITLKVGAGGAGGAGQCDSMARGSSGGDTTFAYDAAGISYLALGGGGGSGNGGSQGLEGLVGGSGGGGSFKHDNAPGDGTAGQGNRGGYGDDTGTWDTSCGGGGGAGAAGGDGSYSMNGTSGYSVGGNGGAGKASDITGETVWYAGGGGGSTFSRDTNSVRMSDPGEGGQGGGGDAAGGNGPNAGDAKYKNTFRLASDGVDGTGGGGGGGTQWKANGSDASWTLTPGGRGGCGTVVVVLSKVASTAPTLLSASVRADHENALFSGYVSAIGRDASYVDVYAVTSVRKSDLRRRTESGYDCLMEAMTFEQAPGAWFDTGIVLDDHTIELDFEYVGSYTQPYNVSTWLGTDEGSGTGYTSVSTYNGYLYASVNNTETQLKSISTGRHTVVYNADGRILMDGVDLGAAENPSTIGTLRIGRRGTDRNWCFGKIYRVRIWDKTGALVRDCLPAVKDGLACFYDAVTATPLYNRATTTDEAAGAALSCFTNAAPSVTKKSAEACAGIAGYNPSSRVSWIDTGIVPSNCQIEATFCYKKSTYLSNGSFFVFGTEGDAKHLHFTCWGDGQKYSWGDGATEYLAGTPTDGEHTLVWNRRDDHHIYLDGTDLGAVSTNRTEIFEPSYTIRIGSRQAKVFVADRFWADENYIRTFKITAQDGTVLRDMTPVVRGGVAAMYDAVTKRYFYNGGGGTLNASGASIAGKLYSDRHDFEEGDADVVTVTNVIGRLTEANAFTDLAAAFRPSAAYNAKLLLRNDLGYWSGFLPLQFDTGTHTPFGTGTQILVK